MELFVNESIPHLKLIRYVGKPTDDEHKRYLDICERDIHHWPVTMTDYTDAPPWSAKHRKMASEYHKRTEQIQASLNKGSAFILPSPVLRGAAMAVSWLFPVPYPHEYFKDPPSAIPFLQDCLRNAGFPAPTTGQLLLEFGHSRFKKVSLAGDAAPAEGWKRGA